MFELQEVAAVDKQLALIALGRFKSCVRTTLLLFDGYECQEKEGTFLLAFGSPRAAVEWALTLQLALLKYAPNPSAHASVCNILHCVFPFGQFSEEGCLWSGLCLQPQFGRSKSCSGHCSLTTF